MKFIPGRTDHSHSNPNLHNLKFLFPPIMLKINQSWSNPPNLVNLGMISSQIPESISQMIFNSFRNFVLLLFLLAAIPFLHAGNDPWLLGGRRVAMGGAGNSNSADLWSLFANPAGMAGLDMMRAGLAVERRFMLASLNAGGFGFGMPFREKHVFGVYAAASGFDLYRENRIGLNYATEILDVVNLGARLNIYNTSIQSYGSAMSPVLDFGITAPVSRQFSAGASVANANLANLSREINEEIPTVLSIGVAYRPSSKVSLVADMVKHVDFPADFRAGLEYKLNSLLSIRSGIATAPVSLNYGFGLKIKNLNLDFGNSHHSDLGYSGHLSIGIDLGNSGAKPAESQPNP